MAADARIDGWVRYEIIAGAWRGKVGEAVHPYITRDPYGQILHLEIEVDGVAVRVGLPIHDRNSGAPHYQGTPLYQ